MHPQDPDRMTVLGGHIQTLVRSAGGSEKGVYAVFGAEGEAFFVELATGPMESRTILKTVFVEFSNTDGVEYRPDPVGEDFISLPDASFLVGFLGLLQGALGRPIRILHPLTTMGDFIPGWNSALASVSKQV